MLWPRPAGGMSSSAHSAAAPRQASALYKPGARMLTATRR